MPLLKNIFNMSAERFLKTAGDLFIYHSDYEGALDMVERVLEMEPNDARAMVLHGDILFCLNRDVEALRVLTHAIEKNPNLPEAYISLAGVLEVLGKHREALKSCRKALPLIAPPKEYLYPSLFDQQIILLIRLSRFRQAQLVLEEAEQYMNGDDYKGFVANYRDLLDQCRKRKQRSESEPKPRLTLCPAAQ